MIISSAFSIMNARNLFGMDCTNRLLNFVCWSVFLHILSTFSHLILYTVLPGVVSTGSFLSARRNPQLLEHLHTAVSELDVKVCWRILIHLIISALQISAPFCNSWVCTKPECPAMGLNLKMQSLESPCTYQEMLQNPQICLALVSGHF